MLWQDLVFLAGSLLTVVALLPTLRNVEAYVPLGTSLPKMGLGAVYALTFGSLGMTLSAVGILATAVMWSLIARYRSPTGRSVATALRTRFVSVGTGSASRERAGTADPNRRLGGE